MTRGGLFCADLSDITLDDCTVSKSSKSTAVSSTILDANKIDALYVSFACVIHTE